jgi:hypothetical protein
MSWSIEEKRKLFQEYHVSQSVMCPTDNVACEVSFRRRDQGYFLKIMCPACNQLLIADEKTFEIESSI